jgi:hypothetical protein
MLLLIQYMNSSLHVEFKGIPSGTGLIFYYGREVKSGFYFGLKTDPGSRDGWEKN